MRRFCAAAATLIIAVCIPMRVVAGPAAAPGAVSCEGLFAKDTDHNKLVAAFGAKNVAFAETDADVEDIKEMATVLYPKDPARRLKIFWQHLKERRFPSEIIIDEEQSQWTAGSGLRVGLSLQQVEALNKTPFKMTGFDSDSAGIISDWDGGTLAHVRGGCVQTVRFGPYPEKEAPSGESLPSNDPKLRSLGLKVIEIFIYYPKVP